MAMGSDEFIEAVEAKAQTGVGYLTMNAKSRLGGERYDTVTIQFINVPREKGREHGGAVAMNNRLLMFVEGFGRGHNEPPPTGKVKLTFGATELLDKRPRGKTATPEKMAVHVAKLITEASKLPPYLLKEINPETETQSLLGLRLGKKDKRVIKAFVDQKALDGHKLTTDGERLDGLWMGGNKLAFWKNGKIELPDSGSRSGQTVQNAVRREAPANDIRAKNSNPDKATRQLKNKLLK